MAWPIVVPAPVVTEHAAVFRDLFDNHCQFWPFQHSLSGLIVLPHKSLANMARCSLDSPDKTNVSRVLAEAPWREDAVNRRRIWPLFQETNPHRHRRRDSRVVLDETLCAHVGSLVDDVDRHVHQSAGSDPLAHHPVTSFSVSGPVRCPVGWRLYRRAEELTPWAAAVAKHVPNRMFPTETQGRHRLHTHVGPVWRQDPACRARHEQFRTKIALAIELVAEAIRHQVPCGVVVFDAWSLAEDVIQVLARRRQDWISLLKKTRRLETASFRRRDANGWALKRPGPHLAVPELVPLIPAPAYRPVTVRAHTYWCFTLAVRIPGRGQVRIVVSLEPAHRTGRSVGLVTNRVAWSAATIIGL